MRTDSYSNVNGIAYIKSIKHMYSSSVNAIMYLGYIFKGEIGMKKLFKGLGIIILVIVGFCVFTSIKGTIADKKEKKETAAETYEWPDTDIAKLLPKPTSKNGEMISEGENHINLDVYGSKNDYKDYIKKCKKKGFDVDYYSSNGMYSAKNKDGYSLTIIYFEEGNTTPEYYSVHLSAPENESEQTEQTTEQATTPTVSFKESMDSYEKSINDYVEFMKKYEESDDQASMVNDYTALMNQYTDTMNKLNSIDKNSLSASDLAYYNEVNGRILQKLTEIQ